MQAPKRSGTQPTRYYIEMHVMNEWSRTVYAFDNRQEAKAAFSRRIATDPTGWYRLVSETILETVTP